MSQPSQNYLRRIEQWLIGGLSLERMNMTVVQRYRAKLVYEAYQIWMQDHFINPTELIRKIAAREYRISLQRAAMGDEQAKEDVEALGIKPNVMRSVSEISNDVYVLNWMVSRFNTSTRDIDKAKVLASADWLMKEGMKSRNDRAVTNGAKLLMEINQSFNEKENPADQMSDTHIISGISGDVGIVKTDSHNYTEEERRRIARKYGLTDHEVQELREQEDGSYAVEEPDPQDDELSEDYKEKEDTDNG